MGETNGNAISNVCEEDRGITMLKAGTPNTIIRVLTAKIKTNPYQPRKVITEESLAELRASIKQYGLLQPIVIRQMSNGDYELIAGERRLQACRMNGMLEIPAILMEASSTDSAILALIENIQRENLGFMEEAEAFSALISEHGLTQEELAERLGKNQSTVANKIRILKLPLEIRKIITENNLTERHARALLRLPDDKMKFKALRSIVSRGLNVIRSEELIESMIQALNAPAKKEMKSIRIFKDIRIFSNTIRQAVDMMKQAGINAETERNEDDNYIEYRIIIPKQMNTQNSIK